MTSPVQHGVRAEALLLEVAHARIGGREQQVRQVIGDDAIDLLRHPAIEAAQPGLDVRERDVELGRRQRRGQRRVGVAVDEHGVGPLARGSTARGAAA